MAGSDDVLDFWCREIGPKGWYDVDKATDAAIARRFGDLAAAAAEGRLSRWLAAPPSALALLVLLDQFPRNIHRGTARAFAADGAALAAACRALALGHDRAMPEPERQFFYLPFMHAESLQHQERGLRLILMRMPETGADNLLHGAKHRDVIRRFGRFPSRNAALGRTDTAAERAYRAAGGYMG